MDDGSLLSVLSLAVLLGLAIYFALAETAFASVSRARIRARQEKGDPRAKRAGWIMDHFDRAITTILIGTNIVHLTAAAVVTVLVSRRWGNGAVVIGTLATTLVLFYCGEMLPKSIARRRCEQLSLATAGSLYVFMQLFRPISAALTAIGNAAAALTKGDPEVSVTEDELYDIIEDMTDTGTLDEDRGDLVSSALEFGDITAEHVLTARVDMAAVDIEWPPARTAQYIREQRHSRLPVYSGQTDNIIGILHIRRFIREYLTQGDALNIRGLLEPAFFVPVTTDIADLLPEMSRKRCNMAVVTDQWGGTLGLVTVEDILEELVGEIWDEEDVVEEYFVPLGGGRFELDARLDVAEAFDRLGFEDPNDDDSLLHKSLAEWTLEQFDLMPKQRDRFTYEGLEFTVSDVQRQRIRKLIARRLPEDAAPEGGADE